MRIFNDGTGFYSYWAELEPDRYWCFDSLDDIWPGMSPYDRVGGTPLPDLRDEYGYDLQEIEDGKA